MSAETLPKWLLLQLCDSAFPTGGFAHSLGLESAKACGFVVDQTTLREFIVDALWQTGMMQLPYVIAAHDGPDNIAAILEQFHSTMLLDPIRKASLLQGRAWIDTLSRVLPSPEIIAVHHVIKSRHLPTHLSPLFGASLGVLGIDQEWSIVTYMFQTLRVLCSAAIRLGLIGPYAGQSLQYQLSHECEKVIGCCKTRAVSDAVQISPMWEVIAAKHESLYSRMFLS